MVKNRILFDISGGYILSYRLKLLLICWSLFIVVATSNALASVTGKISGMVVDEITGEPIVGATIQVVGTEIGTTTDVDGEYFIMNIPSGSYDISVSFLGYEKVVKTGVRVLVDLTTPQDFGLKEAPVELEKAIVVRANNPVIQRDQTASKVIFTAEQLQTLPNIISVQEVLTTYPGVVIGRDRNLHVRGGRSGQVTYYYDGYNVQDPFASNVGMHIVPLALEELSLTSGGFSSEYGEALSGIVNAVSREGGAQYHGSAKFYEGMTHPYDVTVGEWGNLKRIGNRSGSFTLSGPLPGMNSKKYTFFTAGEYLHNPTYLPHNGVASYTGSAKLSMLPSSGFKIKTDFAYYKADGEIYDHRDVNGVSYDFNLDGLPVFRRNSYLVGINTDYAFNERAVIKASVNRFRTETKSAPEQYIDTYWDQWEGYSEDSLGNYNGTIHENNYGSNTDFSDPAQVTGFTVGDDYDPTYSYRKSQYDAAQVSFYNQINKWNNIRSGFELRRYDITWDSKQFYNTNPYGEKYTSEPTYASFYIQDKMEYDHIVLNFGIRYDYSNADISYNVTPGDSVITWKKADSKSRFSPRLGVSFPISEKSVMHFNYGLYYQEARYQYLYMNLKGDVSTGLPLLGNPDLEPEQTVSYELGLNHLIGEDLRISVTAYHKDVDELVTTRESARVAGRAVTQLTNGDYGQVRGFDLALEKLPQTGFLSGSISYSYMLATGNGSTALEPYYTYLHDVVDSLAPVTEYPLDFDQRHTVTAILAYNIPSDVQTNLFGLDVPGDWGLTMVGNYGSGLPYTPRDQFGNRRGERNAGRLPANYSVDMRFTKGFILSGGQRKVNLFVEVDNLFNRKNVLNVYSRTGLADNDGFNAQGGLALEQKELDAFDRLYDKNPEFYSSPRTIRTGFELTF